MSSRARQLMRPCWQLAAVHFGHEKFSRILKIEQLRDRSEAGPAITGKHWAQDPSDSSASTLKIVRQEKRKVLDFCISKKKNLRNYCGLKIQLNTCMSRVLRNFKKWSKNRVFSDGLKKNCENEYTPSHSFPVSPHTCVCTRQHFKDLKSCCH